MCSSDINTICGDLTWVSSVCTLPAVEQPIGAEKFDDLFATSIRAIDRVDPTILRVTVDASAEDRARHLASLESSCCSFFQFDFTPAAGTVSMKVIVPATHVSVLDPYAARAAAVAGRVPRQQGTARRFTAVEEENRNRLVDGQIAEPWTLEDDQERFTQPGLLGSTRTLSVHDPTSKLSIIPSSSFHNAIEDR
jgi:hypothetical protein